VGTCLILTEDGTPVDRVRSYFGIRSLEISGNLLLVNGKRVFQRLVLDQGYYREGIYTAPRDHDLRRDVEISLEMGFNGARLHQKVFEPRFLYWADRLGYMVWGEFPSWGIDMTRPKAFQNLAAEWLEVLGRDVNHPCIVGWCPFNETPRDQNIKLVRSIYEMTKTIDPGRPVIDASGYTHVVTDVYDSHDYDQDVNAFGARHRGILEGGGPYMNHPDHDVPYSGQPVMVSEFGGTWWNPGRAGDDDWGYGNRPRSQSEFMERYDGLVGALLANPKMVGFCYTQLYDIEQEVNGLYTYDREPKFDAALLRRITFSSAAYEGEG
jgi:beta-galactosidase/beta-glucuronidase